MTRYILFLLTAVIGLSAFSQSPSKSLCLRPAYPLAIGESKSDTIAFSSNGLYMYDIIQDVLPRYEIGQIDAQTVRYTEEGLGFYVKADTLHSNNVTFSCDVENAPKGPIEFNETTGRFKYYPTAEDYNSFFVTFRATNGVDDISEKVRFNLMPQTVAEEFAFRTEGTMPDGQDYTLIAEDSTSTAILLNNTTRKGRKFSISGKEVVFDDKVENKVFGLSGRDDICELNIFAERLVVRSALTFPQTNVTIYAKELVFEDKGDAIASINTSPLPLEILENGQGQDGGNAGNITLFVRDFKANPAKRFIMNGAKGQSANRNGTPANGGNGGTLTSNIDLSNYCDFVRGSGGVRFDVADDGSTAAGAVIAAGAMGSDGHFELVDKPYAYLHPYYISAVIRQVNDAFVNNYMQYALQTCSEYKALIDEYMSSEAWSQCEAEDEVELKNDLTEIEGLLFKLDQGLDYFGNPIGWTPLLSFEVMLTNFDNEVERAIPTLYMYYWLSRVDQTLQNKVKANQQFAAIAKQELEESQQFLNSLILEIPVLQDQADEITSRITALKQRIEELQERLMAKARHNVKKRNRIKKAAGICKAVANALPALGPWGAAAGTAINTVLSSGVLDHLTGEDIDYSAAVQTVGDKALDKDFFSTLSENITNAKNSIGGSFSEMKNSFSSLYKSVKPLIENIQGVSKLLSQSSTPDSEIQAEFARLLAESPEYQTLKGEVDSLNTKKEELLNHINTVFANMTTTLGDISNDIISLDAFKREVFDGNSKRDLNAMQYLEKMEQRAKFRLLKYHYYMRKAYEYRLLKPYIGEFNLVGMFERFEQLGSALGDIENPDAYKTLASVFKDVVSQMAEEIIDEYSVNYPEQSVPITIVMPRDQLDAINTGEDVVLNFHKMGIFAPDEENVRIVNLGIQHIDTHINGNVGYSGYMDLNMTHEGISKFRKNGRLYWFNHKSQSTTSPHTWGVRYDAVSKKLDTIQPSAATSSLLAAILETNTANNLMLFSRPSAWGNITLSKKVHTSGGADVVVDSLVLQLQYDFTRRPNNLRNIDITATNGLLPYIACSDDDVNGRSNGSGTFYRTFNQNSQSVTFTAIEQYGSYYFTNWTDRAGSIVSDKPTLAVSRTNDQFYKANYERRPPILYVPDTIYVGHEGGSFTVTVRNKGTGDTEMEWYVSDEKSKWVHLEGDAEGIDNGVFSFKYDTNESRIQRKDSIVIYAPETEIGSKTIYISQVDDPTIGISPIVATDGEIVISPNPTSNNVTVRGEALVSVEIYSATGQKIASYSANGRTHITTNIGQYPNGVYVFAVLSKNGMVTKKVLKN